MISEVEGKPERRPASPQKVADRLRRLCSRREYCSADMMKKAIQALDGDREGAREIVDSLIRDKYVDDARYAEAFVRDKSALAGWGRTKIRYMLVAKGVAKDVTDMALERIDAGKADERMRRLVLNKYNSLKNDPQCRMKLLRFAMGRGYSYPEAEEAVNDVMMKLNDNR